MPIYEYKCSGCGLHFEKMQKVSDAPLESCEKCGGKVEKQISLSGMQFKGQGWYVTDYSNKASGSKNSSKSESSDSTSSSDTASKKAESTSKAD